MRRLAFAQCTQGPGSVCFGAVAVYAVSFTCRSGGMGVQIVGMVKEQSLRGARAWQMFNDAPAVQESLGQVGDPFRLWCVWQRRLET